MNGIALFLLQTVYNHLLHYKKLIKISFSTYFSFFSFHFLLLFAGSLQIDKSEEDDMGKYECVAENAVGTEHSKPTSLYVKVRRVPPQFSRPPEPLNEVMLGSNLTLTCVAVGSPMPYVKWRRGEFSLDIINIDFSFNTTL